MNKTILIAGGASVASLAVGAASGYFIARKRFNDGLGEIISNETEAIKKHYSVLLMEARSGKPGSPEDIPKREKYESADDYQRRLDEAGVTEEDEEQLDEIDRAVIAAGKQALTDYQGISTKAVTENGDPPALGVTTSNVFDKAAKPPKKALPPRDPATGAFRRKTPREEEHEPPQIIDSEAFLLNDPEHNQESLLYFINDKTLVMMADPTEVVDIALAGEVNLTLFPKVGEDEASIIYVRNDGMTTDYEIKLMAESLTDYIGLGEDNEDSGDDSKYL